MAKFRVVKIIFEVQLGAPLWGFEVLVLSCDFGFWAFEFCVLSCECLSFVFEFNVFEFRVFGLVAPVETQSG